MARKKKQKKTGPQPSFVGLERRLFYTEEWRRLIPAAKLLYPFIKCRWSGGVDDEIEAPYSAFNGYRGLLTSKTIHAGFQNLIDEGWIKEIRTGGLYRIIKTYKLTFKYEHFAVPDKDKGKLDYMLEKEKKEAKKNSSSQ